MAQLEFDSKQPAFRGLALNRTMDNCILQAFLPTTLPLSRADNHIRREETELSAGVDISGYSIWNSVVLRS